jgi:hypothetical protein
VIIVGIDCATVAERTGLALAEYADGVLVLRECRVADPAPSVAAQVLPWVGAGPAALLGMDAPLGWPSRLGPTLAAHRAGLPIPAAADSLFKRRTDVLVRERLGKAPLEVGADRIARTALSALAFLEELGRLLGAAVELAWEPAGAAAAAAPASAAPASAVPAAGAPVAAAPAGVRALETYPAGTLRACEKLGLVSPGGDTDARKRSLVAALQRAGRLAPGKALRAALRNEHALDAVLCAVTAADFLDGLCVGPRPGSEQEAALAEGWIWVRDVRG